MLTNTPVAAAGATIPEVTHHRAAVGDVELHHVIAGDAGSPVLLVHGFPETWWAFHRLIPRLAAHHRVVAVDLRGFGDSSTGEADAATHAEDLRALVGQLGLGPVHVLGQDVGGQVAFRLAAEHPDAVRSLTAVETALPGFGAEALADVTGGGAWYIGALVAPGVPERLLAGRERAFLADLVLGAYGAPATAEDVDELVRTYARPGGFSGATGLYRSLLADGDALRALAAERPLAVPALAVGSAGGGFTAGSLAAAGVQARAVALDGVGHYAAMEAPERLAGALLPFLAEADA